MDTSGFKQLKPSLESYQQKKLKLQSEYQFLLNYKNHSVHLKKETSNLFRNRTSPQQTIDVRAFNKVISVDKKNLIAEVEGMCSYETLVRETLKYDCLPTVVPELKSITIGGALSGGGIEASSFRYGLVHETLLDYEILLGDGKIVSCNPNENSDLYYGFPNTYGTLGYALKVKVKLIPAKKYVKLTHYHFKTAQSFFKEIEKMCVENKNKSNGPGYIEGVIFNQDNFHMTLGEFVDTAPFVSNYKYLSIYYRSIQEKKEDFLTTEDFIWRWDSDWFWCSKNFFMQNFFMRLLFGKFALNSIFYWKLRRFFSTNKIAKIILQKFQGRKETIIQDIEVPIQNADQFLEFFEKEIGIYPIWVCPTKPYKNQIYSFYSMHPETLYINFGFWDAIASDKPKGYYNRKIEQKVFELNGHKSLYSDVYYTEQEFWSIFDKDTYQALKQKYDPNRHLKDLYQKVAHTNKT